MSQKQFPGNEQFAEDVDRNYSTGKPIESSDEEYLADLRLAGLLNRASFTPNQAYKTHLHVQLINQLYQQNQPKEIRSMFPRLLRSTLVAVVAAVLMFAVVFAASPDARAATQELLVRFVGVESIGDLLPGDQGLPEGAPDGVSFADGNETNGRPQSPLGAMPPSSDALPKAELITVEAAQVGLEFTIKMPGYLPEGYSFQGASGQPQLPASPLNGIVSPDVSRSDQNAPAGMPDRSPMSTVRLVWRSANGDTLILAEAMLPKAEVGMDEVGLPILGQGAVQNVTVNGQPAQFINGNLTDNALKGAGFFQLHWVGTDGITYDLNSSVLGLEELLAIAESIR